MALRRKTEECEKLTLSATGRDWRGEECAARAGYEGEFRQAGRLPLRQNTAERRKAHAFCCGSQLPQSGRTKAHERQARRLPLRQNAVKAKSSRFPLRVTIDATVWATCLRQSAAATIVGAKSRHPKA